MILHPKVISQNSTVILLYGGQDYLSHQITHRYGQKFLNALAETTAIFTDGQIMVSSMTSTSTCTFWSSNSTLQGNKEINYYNTNKDHIIE